MADFNPEDKGSLKDLEESFKKLGSPMENILDAIGSMYDEADKLNNAFLQGRTRLDEMNDAVSRAAAGVIRLGGDISEVSRTMIGIADGARRNVIATEEQVSKLYAASTILNTDSKTLVETFAQVGYETSQIGPNLEN
jgi:methyl-accepting chemotaxis protein